MKNEIKWYKKVFLKCKEKKIEMVLTKWLVKPRWNTYNKESRAWELNVKY